MAYFLYQECFCLTRGVNHAGSGAPHAAQFCVGFDVLDATVVAGKAGQVSTGGATAGAASSVAANIIAVVDTLESVAAGG